VRISFKSTNTIHDLTKPKAKATYMNTNNVGFTNSHGTHVNYSKSDRLAVTSNKDTRTHTIHKTEWPSISISSKYPKQQNNDHEYGPTNTTLSLQKQINNSSLLSSPEQFHIKSHFYHKELTSEQNTGENNRIYQLIFEPHITSPSAIYTDQY
jgi:hypothetical protein